MTGKVVGIKKNTFLFGDEECLKITLIQKSGDDFDFDGLKISKTEKQTLSDVINGFKTLNDMNKLLKDI